MEIQESIVMKINGNKIEGLVFDMDGLLLDEDVDHVQQDRRCLIRSGLCRDRGNCPAKNSE